MRNGIRLLPLVLAMLILTPAALQLVLPCRAVAAEEFTSPPNPSADILKSSGDGFVGQGIKPGTPVGSRVPPGRDYSQSLKQRQPANPDVHRTDLTNRADRGYLNSPNR